LISINVRSDLFFHPFTLIVKLICSLFLFCNFPLHRQQASSQDRFEPVADTKRQEANQEATAADAESRAANDAEWQHHAQLIGRWWRERSPGPRRPESDAQTQRPIRGGRQQCPRLV